jgi:CRISPR-associated protein Cas2
MRLICLFDLPSVSDEEVKNAKNFREFLLKKGFVMLQWSMYVKHLLYNDSVTHLSESIRRKLPENGNLMLIEMTDRQFESIMVFNNYQTQKPPRKYSELELF